MSVSLFIILVLCFKETFFVAAYILLMVSNWASWLDRLFIRGNVMVDPTLLLSTNILSMAVLDSFCILVAKSTV